MIAYTTINAIHIVKTKDSWLDLLIISWNFIFQSLKNRLYCAPPPYHMGCTLTNAIMLSNIPGTYHVDQENLTNQAMCRSSWEFMFLKPVSRHLLHNSVHADIGIVHWVEKRVVRTTPAKRNIDGSQWLWLSSNTLPSRRRQRPGWREQEPPKARQQPSQEHLFFFEQQASSSSSTTLNP